MADGWRAEGGSGGWGPLPQRHLVQSRGGGRGSRSKVVILAGHRDPTTRGWRRGHWWSVGACGDHWWSVDAALSSSERRLLFGNDWNTWESLGLSRATHPFPPPPHLAAVVWYAVRGCATARRAESGESQQPWISAHEGSAPLVVAHPQGGTVGIGGGAPDGPLPPRRRYRHPRELGPVGRACSRWEGGCFPRASKHR